MEDRRNLVIAILLIGLILFGWPYASDYFFPSSKSGSADVAKTIEAAPPGNPDVVAAPKPAQLQSLVQALGAGARLPVETPKLKGSIALTGARIDDMMLTQHRVGLDKNTPAVRLLSPRGTKDAYFARFGWTAEGIAVPDENTVWTPSGTKLTPQTPVTLSWTNPTGQRFELLLAVDKDYLLTVGQRVTNTGTQAVAVDPWGLLSRNGVSADADSWNIHVGPMGVFNGRADYGWDWEDVVEAGANGARFRTTGGWLGFTDKYWLTALIPDQKTDTQAAFRASGGVYQAQMQRNAAVTVPAGKATTITQRLFVGAKEVSVLDHYTDDLGIASLDYSIDWGWFGVIEKPFFYLLDWLFRMFGNFGLAIIGLTFIIRMAMFPVAQRQFASMAAMRAIAPKQKAIQEKFKDDKQRAQQEIMKLYKEEKVNPLAGCLPIFLQIPIFFALYKVLMLTIEMRHQPFALWLKDLSAPDPLTPVNLFGLLPFTPPGFLAIGVLPILLGFTMWLQQKLNPPAPDPVQQQVFAIMPWFLMFVMAPFAAGLQLYWTVSNLISIAQQKYLYSKHPQLRAMAEKEAADRRAKDAAEKGKA